MVVPHYPAACGSTDNLLVLLSNVIKGLDDGMPAIVTVWPSSSLKAGKDKVLN